jgi:hypothetical protein
MASDLLGKTSNDSSAARQSHDVTLSYVLTPLRGLEYRLPRLGREPVSAATYVDYYDHVLQPGASVDSLVAPAHASPLDAVLHRQQAQWDSLRICLTEVGSGTSTLLPASTICHLTHTVRCGSPTVGRSTTNRSVIRLTSPIAQTRTPTRRASGCTCSSSTSNGRGQGPVQGGSRVPTHVRADRSALARVAAHSVAVRGPKAGREDQHANHLEGRLDSRTWACARPTSRTTADACAGRARPSRADDVRRRRVTAPATPHR